jgi:hypothetical protein
MDGQQNLLQQILDFTRLPLKSGSNKAAYMTTQLLEESAISPLVSAQAREEQSLKMNFPAAQCVVMCSSFHRPLWLHEDENILYLHNASANNGRWIMLAAKGIRQQADSFCGSKKYFAMAVTGFENSANYLSDLKHSALLH